MKPKEFFASQREKPEAGFYIATFVETNPVDGTWVPPDTVSVILRWIPSGCKWYAPNAVHGWEECGYLDGVRPPGFTDELKLVYVRPLSFFNLTTTTQTKTKHEDNDE